MGLQKVDICSLYGYGWERQLTAEDLEILSYAIEQTKGLSDTQRAAARHVLGVEMNPAFSKWHERIGRAVIRENTSPLTCGIHFRELILPTDPPPPWRLAEVADMLGLTPSKLRDLVKCVRNGKLRGLPLPGRNIGRSRSERGWYVWLPEDVRAWHAAMIAGRFDSWRARSRPRKKGGEKI